MRRRADVGRDTLSQVIEQQLSRFAGLAGIGQNAVGATAEFGANSVANQNALRNAGAGAKAGDILTRGGITAGMFKSIGNFGDSAVSAFLPGGGGLKGLF